MPIDPTSAGSGAGAGALILMIQRFFFNNRYTRKDMCDERFGRLLSEITEIKADVKDIRHILDRGT